MTYSLCLADGGAHGVASATKAPAVGSLGPYLSKHGVVCTQSIVDTSLGARAVRLVDDGHPPGEAVERLLAEDDHAALRQVHGLDRRGNAVTFTGADCTGWCGDREGPDYTVAGNMLVGPDVLDEMVAAVGDTVGEPMVERLLAALAAGEAAGGDKRGPKPQSAALRIYHPEEPRLSHDLRVDDHDDPIAELRRLYEVTSAVEAEWREAYPETVYQRHP